MSILLAIDGGNSKTEVLLADTTGAVLGYARGAGSNHQTAGMAEALSRLDELVRVVRDRAGIPAGTRPALAAVYLAGADLPVELDTLDAAVGGSRFADRSIVDNDILALLRAGTEAPDAVAVVCGAGTNCAGRAADGRTVRFPALGRLTGDWGGGQHLGGLALWHAARAEDGRGPDTALVSAITAHFGLARIADVSAAAHFGEISHECIGELSPMLFRVAATGDEVARALVVRQGEEIAIMAGTAIRRLGLLEAEVSVVLGGGVLRSRDPVLFGALTERLTATAPGAEIALVTDPPVIGAALLGLDALGVAGAAPDRLRRELRALIAAG
ncbi:MAG TPA: BadF/BadG/BcrA/BcrD ATPase family protein [Actinophytocola sp.]|uniref:N-acetylglucosamine kinase n=1 Tax=Actinophytocola sp. TaxID=1872138 RepID=UPI002DB9A264|nr:BadF/BadG/BcrA/BcrD ATPase family protein [Actinophytocola sp.]HEU5475104.1 BadF/BadG/BcrA/BcrD ATPase family protein [Actinophytocola sp.]